MNAEQSILKHIGLAGVLKGYGIYDNVITAMEDYAQERVKNCSIPAVVGRSEQFYCADWDRCGSVCEEQCNACIKADNMPEVAQ